VETSGQFFRFLCNDEKKTYGLMEFRQTFPMPMLDPLSAIIREIRGKKKSVNFFSPIYPLMSEGEKGNSVLDFSRGYTLLTYHE
jgi:hypothetical protein